MTSSAAQVERCIADVGHWMSANRLKLIRTRLSYSGSDRDNSLFRQGCCLPVLQLGPDSIAARDHVRLLGVTQSSDLSLDRHVSTVSSSGFYWLRQLQRSRRSLDIESVATLVHAFMSSRVDYCNAVLAGLPKVTTDRLRVLNAAARCRQWYEEVRPRLVAAAAHSTALARCTRVSQVQAQRHGGTDV